MDVYFDIDGTLSNASHRQHYVQGTNKNWVKFYEGMIDDTLHEDIKSILDLFYYHRNRIIICTGRPSEYREITIKWLEYHKIFYDALYMRSQGDYRSDAITKIELLEQMRKDGYNPKIAFDDRQRVVDALRANGVRVLQVAPGDF